MSWRAAPRHPAVVKRVLLSTERTLTRKFKEAILAAEITRRYSKDEILELYLNEVYYGSLAYGIDARQRPSLADAARSDARRSFVALRAAPVAGLLRSVHASGSPKERQAVVLGLMVKAGYITQAELTPPGSKPLVYAPLQFRPERAPLHPVCAPAVGAALGPEVLYQSGYQVTTTLDPALQAQPSASSPSSRAAADRNVSNGALVAMRPQNAKWWPWWQRRLRNPEIDGQVNMALSRASPAAPSSRRLSSTFEQPDRRS